MIPKRPEARPNMSGVVRNLDVTRVLRFLLSLPNEYGKD